MNLQEFIQNPLLKKVKKQGDGYIACCPAHGDDNPSLSIGSGSDGRILLRCHTGCTTESIVRALNLEMKDLYPAPQKEPRREIRRHYYLNGYKAIFNTAPRAMWVTVDQDGKTTYKKPPDTFLYNMGAFNVLVDDLIFIAEGEKDVDTLVRLGYPCVCAPDGAGKGKWYKEANQYFTGKKVVIFEDNDDTGRAFAKETADNLLTVTNRVKIVDLRQVWQGMPNKCDISDYLAQGRDFNAVLHLIANTPTYSPESSDLVNYSNVTYAPPRWLLKPYFQLGKGTLIQGDGGTGKTAFMCAIIAAITTGANLYRDIEVQESGNVLIFSAEDEPEMLKGRLEANGADMTKIFSPKSITGYDFTSEKTRALIERVKPKLILFDPLQSFLGSKVDMHRANETRPVMDKLFEMAKRYDCSVAVIAHIGKMSMGKSAVTQALGSVDIGASMRSIMHLVKNPSDKAEVIAFHVKSSYAKNGENLTYNIVDRGGVVFTGYSDLDVDCIAMLTKRNEKAIPYDNEPLVQVIRKLIADKPQGGFWSYSEFAVECLKICGKPIYDTVDYKQTELKRRLEDLAEELQLYDGIVVQVGVRTSRERGLKLTRYEHDALQYKLNDD